MNDKKHQKFYNEYEKFYDAQIKTLGLHLYFDNNLDLGLLASEEYKRKVISVAKEELSNNSNIPFLLVVPFMGLKELIRMVQNKDKINDRINISLNLSRVTDLFEVPLKSYYKIPEKPYFVFNIDSTSTMGFTPEKAWKTVINKKDKKPLTTYEMLSLVLHTEILQFHNLWSLGSRCNRNYQCVAGISCQREEVWRKGKKEMKLSEVTLRHYLKNKTLFINSIKWSSPSCSLRLLLKS